MQICIYTPIITPRIRYIMDFLFTDVLGIPFQLTDQLDLFLASADAKFSYCKKVSDDIPFFAGNNFLLQTEITKINLQKVKYGDIQVPFAVHNGMMPFDIFSASFYILTRFEEYVHKKFSRRPFTFEDSLQKKDKYLDKPIINYWIRDLLTVLQRFYPNLKASKQLFRIAPLIHAIPSPPKPQGLIKSGKLFIENITHKDGRKTLLDNLAGLGMNQTDNLQFLNNLCRETGCQTHYFVNLGSYEKFRLRVTHFTSQIKDTGDIGFFHPCFIHDANPSIKLFQEQILKERNQALLLTHQLEQIYLPNYYLRLQKLGVNIDFSMGYKQRLGFRAGTCSAFKWYDMQIERPTALIVHPYCATDSALFQMEFSVAKEALMDLIDHIASVDGVFTVSWELRNLSNNVKFKKWRAMYEEMTHYAIHRNEYTSTF